MTLLLKATQLSYVLMKLWNLKLLWEAGTLVVVMAGAARAATTRLSTTMRATSMAMSSLGGAAVASEMEGRGRLLEDDGCLVLASVLDDTPVPATDRVEEVLSVLWSLESTWTLGGTGCVGADDYPTWEFPAIKVWSLTVPQLPLRTKAQSWWTDRVGAAWWYRRWNPAGAEPAALGWLRGTL